MMTWILLRAAGIGAYVALWLSVAWGLVATTGVVKRRISKPSANTFHALVATVGLVLLAVHLALLVVDSYMPFGVADVLTPMHATFRPVAITAGVLAMYGIVIVMVTSWVRTSMNTRLWRAIHFLAIPAFMLAFLHGVFAGTDTGRTWMIALYGTTGVITFFLVVVRGLTADYRPPRPTPATPPGAAHAGAHQLAQPLRCRRGPGGGGAQARSHAHQRRDHARRRARSDTVLTRIVELAVEITGATYGALGRAR